MTTDYVRPPAADDIAWLIERDAGANGIEYLRESHRDPRHPSRAKLYWAAGVDRARKFDTRIAAEAFRLSTGLVQPEYLIELDGARVAEHMWSSPANCRSPAKDK